MPDPNDLAISQVPVGEEVDDPYRRAANPPISVLGLQGAQHYPGTLGLPGIPGRAATNALTQAQRPTQQPAQQPPRLPYQTDWRGTHMGEYDPRYMTAVKDVLHRDNDPSQDVIATKDKLVPKDNAQLDIPAKPEPGVIYRGMSAPEYEDFLRTGSIKSKGEYNIGQVQEGLTYYTTNPDSAAYYASAFAPQQHKATFDKPAYVVAVRAPPDDRTRRVEGTAEHEVGVMGPVHAADVLRVYRGNVIGHNPPINESGFSKSSSSWLHWEELHPQAARPVKLVPVDNDPFAGSR